MRGDIGDIGKLLRSSTNGSSPARGRVRKGTGECLAQQCSELFELAGNGLSVTPAAGGSDALRLTGSATASNARQGA